MQRKLTSRRRGAALLIGIATSAAIAACGGSSSSGSRAASAKTDGLTYAACVRAHGVPDYPDPGMNKFGGALNVKADKVTVDGHPLSESWQVVRPAIDRCQRYIEPAFGPRYSAGQLAKIRTGALAMSKCMRAHGLASYPDLKVSAGPGGRGFEVSVPKMSHADATSPAFKADNIACSKLLNKTVPGKG
jgi:hypothetical protein